MTSQIPSASIASSDEYEQAYRRCSPALNTVLARVATIPETARALNDYYERSLPPCRSQSARCVVQYATVEQERAQMVHNRVLLPVRSDAVPLSVSEHRCDHRQLRTCWTHRFQHAMADGHLVQRSAPSFVTAPDRAPERQTWQRRLLSSPPSANRAIWDSRGRMYRPEVAWRFARLWIGPASSELLKLQPPIGAFV